MDEARRFLRYVTPGLVFLTEVLLVFWVVAPDWTLSILDGFKKAVGIGLAIATLFASGGMGFVFSSIHHYIHWRCEENCVIDHRALISSLRSRGVLCLIDRDSSNALPEDKAPNRFQAWAILTALWHERLTTNEKVKGADPRVTSLADLAHSAGSATVAAGSAWVISLSVLYYCCSFSTEIYAVLRFIFGNALAVVLIWLHHKGYETAGKAMEKVVEEILCDALTEEATKNGVAIQTHVTFNDGIGSYPGCRKTKSGKLHTPSPA